MMEGKSILAKATISTCRIRAKHAKNSSYMLRDECRQNFPSEKYESKLNMPQEHNVVRCFSCGIFQAHIVKKVKKWECKMCGAKQSLKRNYGQGSGKECRLQVMRLNQLQIQSVDNINSLQTNNQQLNAEKGNNVNLYDQAKQKITSSKWTKYLDEEELNDENDNELENRLSENIDKKRKRENEETYFQEKKKFSNEKPDTNLKTPVSTFANVNFEFSTGIINNNFVSNLEDFEKPNTSKFDLPQSENCKNNDNLVKKIKKSSNVFGLDSNDLDDIMNMNF